MSQAAELSPGAIFAGDFRIVRPLGAGGMGAIYIVEQVSTGRERALKVMHAAQVQNARTRERFVQEARVGARIKSEHVVEVVSAGVDEATGAPWLVMELLEGEELLAWASKRGPLAPGDVLEIFRQLCHGLSAAHRAGLVHRDLKPQNVFMAAPRRDGVAFTVKILDFGIAKLLSDNQLATSATEALGSPVWMSPEQTDRGAQVSPATDVWALGLLAFYLLTGKRFWRAANDAGGSIQAVMVELLLEPIPSASARAAVLDHPGGLPAGFDAWFARCVTRSAGERFADAGEALAALVPVLSDGGVAFEVTSRENSGGSSPKAIATATATATGAREVPPAGETTTTAPVVAPAGPAPRARTARVGFAAVAVLGVLAAGVWLRVYQTRRANRGRTPPAVAPPSHATTTPVAPPVVTPPVAPSGVPAVAPEPPRPAPVVVNIAVGTSHTCARLANGTVRCWGLNDAGQLGDGATTNALRPVVVAGLQGVEQVALGDQHTCAVLTDGTLRCWGRNTHGQLGDGTRTDRAVPTAVPGLTGVASVALGRAHSCAVTTEGVLRCWGDNAFGQLGDGTRADRLAPTPVALRRVREVDLGGGHTCARLLDGGLRCWGDNVASELGTGDTSASLVPVRVAGLRAVQQFSLGGIGGDEAFTCALLIVGGARCWGANRVGQLGDGTTVNRAAPVAVADLGDALQVAAGSHHVCARMADGGVRCWGRNLSGQLGDGTTVNRSTPVAVEGASEVLQIATGLSYTCARWSNGGVRCWGSNLQGQLGDGTQENHARPVAVAW